MGQYGDRPSWPGGRPGVERAARELADRLKAVKVNVDEAPRIAERVGVQGIPTLLNLRQGREVARQVGSVPPSGPAVLGRAGDHRAGGLTSDAGLRATSSTACA